MVKLKVKPKEDVVTKWIEEAPKRATYYGKYTPAAAEDWEKNAVAAAGIYKSAVQAANIDKLFAGGIKRVGASKFRRKVESVGVSRYGPGITAAREDYEAGIDWVLSELAAIDIPERKPRGDPANYDRVRKIGEALHRKRLARYAALPGATSS